VCSKLVVLRERLRAIHLCTLDRTFSEYSIDLNPTLPSMVSLPYVSTRVLSNAARSKTSSSNPLLGTQRGDRNQADESGRELGDESLVDMIYRRSCTQTAAVIDRVQLNATDRAERKTHLPCMRPLVFLKPTRLAIRFVTARESAMVLSLRIFHQRAIDQDKLGFFIRVSGCLGGLGLGLWVSPRYVALVVVRFRCRKLEEEILGCDPVFSFAEDGGGCEGHGF